MSLYPLFPCCKALPQTNQPNKMSGMSAPTVSQSVQFLIGFVLITALFVYLFRRDAGKGE